MGPQFHYSNNSANKTGCNFRLLEYRVGIRVLKDRCTRRAAAAKGAPGDALAGRHAGTCPLWECSLGQDCSEGAVATAVGESRRRRKCGANRLVCGFWESSSCTSSRSSYCCKVKSNSSRLSISPALYWAISWEINFWLVWSVVRVQYSLTWFFQKDHMRRIYCLEADLLIWRHLALHRFDLQTHSSIYTFVTVPSPHGHCQWSPSERFYITWWASGKCLDFVRQARISTIIWKLYLVCFVGLWPSGKLVAAKDFHLE